MFPSAKRALRTGVSKRAWRWLTCTIAVGKYHSLRAIVENALHEPGVRLAGHPHERRDAGRQGRDAERVCLAQAQS